MGTRMFIIAFLSLEGNLRTPNIGKDRVIGLKFESGNICEGNKYRSLFF